MRKVAKSTNIGKCWDSAKHLISVRLLTGTKFLTDGRHPWSTRDTTAFSSRPFQFPQQPPTANTRVDLRSCLIRGVPPTADSGTEGAGLTLDPADAKERGKRKHKKKESPPRTWVERFVAACKLE